MLSLSSSVGQLYDERHVSKVGQTQKYHFHMYSIFG